MDINYLGHSSFRVKGKTATFVTDPFNPDKVGLKFPRVSADIVSVSHEHEDHNFLEKISGVKRIVSGPGEYEIQGISIVGILSFHDEKKGQLRGKNTIFVFEVDGLRIGHLGDLGHRLDEKTLERMGSIDILMIPCGGEYTIGSSIAAEVARNIEANIVIPMHYKLTGHDLKIFGKLEKVESFLRELGLPVEKVDKLTIRKENLGEEQKVVVLNVK